MYHCKLRIGYIGNDNAVRDCISAMNAPAGFSYEFSRDAENCDVIFAEFGNKIPESGEIILLAGRDCDCGELLLRVSDLWIMPMSAEELKFRLEKWQKNRLLQANLWLSENYLNTLIDGTPDLIWFKALDGSHIKVNRSFCDTVHKTREQVQGQKHAYIWDVECESPSCIASDNEAIHGRHTSVSEEIVDMGSGRRLLTTYKNPLFDFDGSVMGTVGIGTDITKEREYEHEIVKKNRVLEKIFTSIDCGVMSHSLDGHRILSANDAALRLLGYTSIEEMTKGGFDMVAQTVLDEDKPILRAAISSLEEVGDSISVEYRVRHDDGELIHVMGNIKLLCEGGEKFYQRFLLDITHQKMVEQENTRRHLELVHALCIDYNLVCSYDLDTGKGNTLQNLDCEKHRLREMFAGSTNLEDSFGSYISECVLEDDREMFREATSRESLLNALSDRDTFHINYRTRCDNQVKYFQMKAVRTGDWNQCRVVVLGFRSVDDEIRAEMEKKELLEDALMQANRANKAKSAFLSNMSHDIRTPMNAIVGFTTLAISHIDDRQSVEEYLKKIMTSGNHMLGLINDVLDMSRIESGKLHIEERQCSLIEIIRKLCSIINGDVAAKHQQFRVDVTELSDEDVICDELRLNQILLNLLNNSIKYTESGGEILFKVVERRGKTPDSAEFEFVVKDNGIGMSREFLEHIFEPFERERNTTLSGIQGTGLGMAITKNIVDMMRGRIEIQSEQGVGTECRVTFGFKLAHAVEAPLEPKTEGVGDGVHEPRKLRSGRILLVEDNELNCEIATALLTDAGFTVEHADNGKRAVEMVEGSEPGYYDVALMDVQMPVMNGYEAARAIRALDNKELSSIPILAMTANAFDEDKQEALHSGMNGHLAKPFDIEKLLETLDSLLENGH